MNYLNLPLKTLAGHLYRPFCESLELWRVTYMDHLALRTLAGHLYGQFCDSLELWRVTYMDH